MRKIRDLIRLKFMTRLSHEQIARALSISKGVVAKYAARIQRCGIEPRELLQLSDAQMLKHVQPRLRREVYGDRAPVDCAQIHTELKRPGVTLTLLWQEYVAANAGHAAYRYSQFALRYHTYVASLRRSMRQVHRAGEKLFIDYAGQSISYGGEGQRAQIFVAVLGSSNYAFACATAHQRLEDWIGALVRALIFIGGEPQLIVPDNARALIADPDRYEPRASLTVQDLAHHYDTAVLPARPRRPQDKAKVEVAVQVVERWILARLRDHRFQTLEEVDGAIGDLFDALNTRAFRRLPGSRQSAYDKHPEQGYRACLGLLKLEKHYGAQRLEAACVRALALGSPAYQTVASILKRRVESLPLADESSWSSPEHDHLRGPKYYQ